MYEYNLGIRFQQIVEERSQHTALWFSESQSVTFGDLNARANHVARLLQQRNVTKGDVVCLSGEKSIETFACIIACLKIGAIYCVIDPATPVERLRKILSTCKPRLIFAGGEFIDRFSDVISALGIETLNSVNEL